MMYHLSNRFKVNYIHSISNIQFSHLEAWVITAPTPLSSRAYILFGTWHPRIKHRMGVHTLPPPSPPPINPSLFAVQVY